MPIYGIGFILAALLFLYFVIREGEKITKIHVALAILLAIFSWIGVIIVLLISPSYGKKK